MSVSSYDHCFRQIVGEIENGCLKFRDDEVQN